MTECTPSFLLFSNLDLAYVPFARGRKKRKGGKIARKKRYNGLPIFIILFPSCRSSPISRRRKREKKEKSSLGKKKKRRAKNCIPP